MPVPHVGPSDMTPLHMAANVMDPDPEADAMEAAVELLRAGADPLAVNDQGASALYIAIVEKHPALAVEMLATLERRDEEDGTVYPDQESRVGKALFKSDRRSVRPSIGQCYDRVCFCRERWWLGVVLV